MAVKKKGVPRKTPLTEEELKEKLPASPRSGHALTRADQQRGGRAGKGKPKVSIRNLWKKILAEDVPKQIEKAVRQKKIISAGKEFRLNKEVFDPRADMALALAIFAEALSGEGWAARLIVEYIDGPAQLVTGGSENLDETSIILKPKVRPKTIDAEFEEVATDAETQENP